MNILNNEIKTLISLGNKVLKYKRKLIAEAMKLCKEQRLEIIVTEEKDIENSSHFVIEKYGEHVDVEHFISLVKEKFPSLYRKYISKKQEYICKRTAQEYFNCSANSC